MTSCKGLLRLAANVQVKGVIAPREIILTLSDTIQRRDHLHKWFREQSLGSEGEEANIRHKVFNSTLVSFYNSIKITKTTHTFVRGPKQLKSASSKSDFSLPELCNRFASLDNYPGLDESLSTPSQSTYDDELAKSKTPSESIAPIERDFDILTDDMVSMYIEAFLALVNLDNLLEILKSTWVQAGRGEIAFNVAATMSRTIWNWARDDFYVLIRTGWPSQLDTFTTLIEQLKRSGTPPGWNESDLPASMACTWEHGLITPFAVMDDFLQHPSQPKDMPKFKDALAIVCPESDHKTDARAMLLMLQCMIYAEIKPDADIIDNSLRAMTKNWFENPSNERDLDRLKVAFYLRYLLESSRAYQFANGVHVTLGSWHTINPPENLRVRAMRHLKEVGDTYMAIAMSPYARHCCKDSFGAYAGGLSLWIDKYLRDPHYDVYYQNPTVAGEILISMGMTIQKFSCKIANHRHHLASILHVYNALTVMNDIEPIPILDELCSFYEDIILLGSRPKTNFSSIFTRHRDGKVQYGNAYVGKHGHDLGSNLVHGMKLPDDSGHVETNARRFQMPIDTSISFETILGALTTDYYWANVLNLKDNWVKTTDASWLQGHHINQHPLLYVREQLNNEFNGRAVPCVDLSIMLQTSTSSAKSSTELQTSTPTSPDSVFHSNNNSPTRTSHVAAVAGPRIRLVLSRPSCGCHEGMSHLRVLEKERQRGTGLLPVMRLNIGVVWLACADVYGKVNRANNHRSAKLEEHEEPDCMCLADEILLAADAYVERQRRNMRFPRSMLKKRWIEAIETFREKKPEDFLWKWM